MVPRNSIHSIVHDERCLQGPGRSAIGRGHNLTPLEPRSRFGDNPFKFQVIRTQNGTAVLKGLKALKLFYLFQKFSQRDGDFPVIELLSL